MLTYCQQQISHAYSYSRTLNMDYNMLYRVQNNHSVCTLYLHVSSNYIIILQCLSYGIYPQVLFTSMFECTINFCPFKTLELNKHMDLICILLLGKDKSFTFKYKVHIYIEIQQVFMKKMFKLSFFTQFILADILFSPKS